VVLTLFAWENCHLLCYLAMLLLVMYAGRRRSAALGERTQRSLLVPLSLPPFSLSCVSLRRFRIATTLNRALMPLDPAVCCFLALVVHRDVRIVAGRQTVRKEPLMPDRESQR
jgi:hypothetical protein